MEKIKLNKNYLDTLFWTERTYCDIYYDKDKVYKIFFKELDSTLIEELEYLNSLNLSSITNPMDLIILNNKIQGFTMKKFNGVTFSIYNENYIKKLKLLKLAKEQMTNIHKYSITLGDLHDGNILYNDEKVIFCDPDGFIFSPFENKRRNIWENEYFEYFKRIDTKCDIYLFNLLTLALLLKINWTTIGHRDFRFKSNELNQIIEFINYFNENSYSDKYIIDYLPKTEKEFKKLTKKI